MNEERIFLPNRRLGIWFHLFAIGGLLGTIGVGLLQASRMVSGLAFLVYIAATLGAGILAPMFAYRLYVLWRGNYLLERDGIRIRWGWRVEAIPVDQIEWLGSERKYHQALPRPWVSWPGAVVGQRRLADGRSLEYLADRAHNLVLIETPERTFAISPADPGDFIYAFRRMTELGSLTPIPALSVRPQLLFSRVQADISSRLLFVINILLVLVLFTIVVLAVPQREQVALRFTFEGQPGGYVPSTSLFLLPVLNFLFVAADLFMGLFFYRRPDLRVLAYLIWGAGLVTSGLFLSAVFFILIFS